MRSASTSSSWTSEGWDVGDVASKSSSTASRASCARVSPRIRRAIQGERGERPFSAFGGLLASGTGGAAGRPPPFCMASSASSRPAGQLAVKVSKVAALSVGGGTFTTRGPRTIETLLSFATGGGLSSSCQLWKLKPSVRSIEASSDQIACLFPAIDIRGSLGLHSRRPPLSLSVHGAPLKSTLPSKSRQPRKRACEATSSPRIVPHAMRSLSRHS